MQTTNDNNRLRRPRLAAYAALLAIALFQLSFAMHQAEHTVDKLGETCVVCSHFHDFGPVSEPADLPSPAPIAGAAIPTPPAAEFETHRYPIHVRAPPFA
jgi:hypothetical protein